MRYSFIFFFILISTSVLCDQNVLLIGIAGGSASGKTTLANQISKAFNDEVLVICQDDYYKPLDHLSLKEREEFNFDHPDAIDFELLYNHLSLLKNNRTIQIPVYDFSINTRTKNTISINPKKIVIVEGILLFWEKRLRDAFDIKLYVATDDDIRLLRRLERDIKERGRTFENVKKQYFSTVAPMHRLFVEPSMRYSDFIIPGGINNHIAIQFIIDNLKNHLKQK